MVLRSAFVACVLVTAAACAPRAGDRANPAPPDPSWMASRQAAPAREGVKIPSRGTSETASGSGTTTNTGIDTENQGTGGTDDPWQ